MLPGHVLTCPRPRSWGRGFPGFPHEVKKSDLGSPSLYNLFSGHLSLSPPLFPHPLGLPSPPPHLFIVCFPFAVKDLDTEKYFHLVSARPQTLGSWLCWAWLWLSASWNLQESAPRPEWVREWVAQGLGSQVRLHGRIEAGAWEGYQPCPPCRCCPQMNW